jgi:hypothetical protein
VRGIERHRLVEAGECFLEALECFEQHAAIADGIGEILVDRDCPVVAGERFAMSPELLERSAAIVEYAGMARFDDERRTS